MSSVKRRLLVGFGVNTFGRFSATLVQIISVPVFLSHWGTGLYGEWLLLNAIPTYFNLSDIGFGTVAGNEMTMLVAAQKREEAVEVFQSVWVLTTVISSLVGLLLFASIWFIPLNRWLNIHAMSVRDARLIILFLGLSVLLGMQETLLQASFRCVGRYSYGSMIKQMIGLSSFGTIMLAVLLGAGPKAVALAFMIVNGLGILLLLILLRR
jgi:hypothetical protein